MTEDRLAEIQNAVNRWSSGESDIGILLSPGTVAEVERLRDSAE